MEYESSFSVRGNYAITGGPGSRDVGPSIEGGAVQIVGDLKGADLDAGLRPHSNALLHCYASEVRSDAALSGTVVMAFTVEVDGTVAQVETRESELKNESVTQCLERRLAKVELPEEALTTSSQVTISFRLQPN